MTGLARDIYRRIIPRETRMRVHKLFHLKGMKELRTSVFSSEKGDFSLKPYDENQCIFIHITKTAGTSVATGLFGYLPYHYTAIDYRVIYGRKTFDQYYKFAFVRNPWDRLYSAYRYLKSGGWNQDDKLWTERNLGEINSFSEFVKTWVCEKNICKHRHFWPQHQFICDEKKRLLVDHLAYFETLTADFNEICSILNIDTQLARHNTNPGNDYRDAYDDVSRKIVANVYASDIELFGYDFDHIVKRKIIKTSH